MISNCSPSSTFRLIRVVSAIASLTAASVTVLGQSVIMSLPQEPLNAPVIREAQAAQQGINGSRPPASETLFTRGSVTLRAHIMYRYLKAEGLPSGARRVDSEIQSIVPTVSLDLGRNWSVSYIPSWTYYAAPEMEDTFDQSASIHGGLIGLHWLLTLDQTFSFSSPTLYETGRQTEQKTWSTHVSASRSIGSRYNLELNGSVSGLQSEIGNDSRDWSTDDWFMVQISPALNVGIGPTFGYVDMSGSSPDMTYQRFMGRLSFNPTSKLSLNAGGGVERRQSDSEFSKDIENPIINADLSYRPFETTTIGVSYNHTVSTSLYDNQVTVGSNWSLHFEQRLLGHVYFSASWNHGESEYLATTTVTPPPEPIDPEDPSVPPFPVSQPGRKDKTETFDFRLTTQLFRRLSIAATYQHSENRSSQGLFDVSSKQYGIELNCSF